jgi:hypothetical protein
MAGVSASLPPRPRLSSIGPCVSRNDAEVVAGRVRAGGGGAAATSPKSNDGCCRRKGAPHPYPPHHAAGCTHLRRSQSPTAIERLSLLREAGRVARCVSSETGGALSGNAPHPSAWLRQSATLPFVKGRDRRLTRCVHAVAPPCPGSPSHAVAPGHGGRETISVMRQSFAANRQNVNLTSQPWVWNRRVLPVRVTCDIRGGCDGIRLKRARVNGAGGVA